MAGKHDYSSRDKEALYTFYVPLWKRNGISLQLFDDYWRCVHGAICARLPGQYQYWQFHVAHNEGGIFPEDVVKTSTLPADQFDGIAELTFKSDEDRNAWFEASQILMDDEHNLFSKAIGYTTGENDSITYTDGIECGDPNGALPIVRYHVMVRKAAGVSNEAFQTAMKSFAQKSAQSKDVLKMRLHLFQPLNTDRPDAPGVSHSEAPEDQFQAAFEVAFSDPISMEYYFANAYRESIDASVIKEIVPFKERDPYTFVYNGQMTLAGERGSVSAQLITNLGAVNNFKADISDLMLFNKR